MRVEFLPVYFYSYTDENDDTIWILCEPRLDISGGKFVRYNDNLGGVKDQKGDLEEILKRNP